MKFLIVCSIFFIIFESSFGAIPPNINLCKYADLQCIAQSTTKFVNQFRRGNSEFGLPDLDPLKVKKLIVGEGPRSSIGLELILKDFDMFGLGDFNVNRAVGFESDPGTSKFELYAVIPKIHLKGQYTASGRLLILPIQGEGPFDIVLDNVKTSVKIKSKTIMKNGKVYAGIEKFKLLLEPSKMTARLDNLFNGDRTLGDNLNKFLNESWKDVWTEIGPNIDKYMGEIMKNIVTNIFNTVAYEDLFKHD